MPPAHAASNTRTPSGSASFDFTDRVVVVTGASGGIGSAVVDLFARAGADVLLHGRDVQALDRGAERVRALGRRAATVSGNIRSPETAAAIVDTALSELGGIDVLVNNAGGNFGARLEDLSVNAWNATIEANLSGAFHLAKACLPTFRESGGGVIVNVGSASANYAHPMRGAYAAAKAGLASLTRTMAWEWAHLDVRVNCIEPGAVMTPSSRFAGGDTEQKVARYVALGRVGTPEDIAKVVAFLSSDAAAYITGESLVVAGGPHTSTPADVELVPQSALA
jgi:3-oxoacyl-[acyl-carrier protein] reductase